MHSWEPISLAIALAVTATYYNSDPIPIQSNLGVNLEIVNGGDIDLTDFLIQMRDHPDGEWYTFLSAADLVAGTDANILKVVGTPGTLAAAAKCHIGLRANAADSIRVRAKGGVGTLTIRGGKIRV